MSEHSNSEKSKQDQENKGPEAPPAINKPEEAVKPAISKPPAPKQFYTGYGMNPFVVMLVFGLYLVIVGAILLSKNVSAPKQAFDYSFYLADMKFSQMSVTIIQEYFELVGGVKTPVVNTQKSTPSFKNNKWVFGAVQVPYSVETSDLYNVTINYVNGQFSYNATYSLTSVQIGTNYFLQRPKVIVFDAKPSFNRKYLSPHASSSAEAYVGILDIQVEAFYYQDAQIQYELQWDSTNTKQNTGIGILAAGLLVLLVTAVGIQYGLSLQRQTGIIAQLYKRQNGAQTTKMDFKRKYNRDGKSEFKVNRYPPLMYE
ncbi:Transmembrane_domain-containing protein [Hexamita inflata]|uniref:Transmembrane domain-containing protein n=1 Tax=Hexamita inflata TaxID=28002 RepID=A0AA86RLQ7_9EUKA|nr:Transmembrane domain-containing protein [Hexamita inflata]